MYDQQHHVSDRPIIRLRGPGRRHPAGRREQWSKPCQDAPKAKKPVGHEKLLKRAIENGFSIRVVLLSGEIITGKVVDSDKYTISFEPDHPGGTVECVFKHGIESFRIID